MASLAEATEAKVPARLELAIAEHGSLALQQTMADLDIRGWYPAEALIELLEIVFHSVIERDGRMLESLGEAAIEADMRGFHKLLLRVFSPSYAVHSSRRLMGAYLNYGSIEISERSPIAAQLEVRLDPGSELLWSVMVGAMRGILGHSGAIDVHVHQENGAGPGECRFRLRWS